MPELPEVETTKNELKQILLNRNIKRILINTNSLRIPINKKKMKQLEGYKVIKILRRGKYIKVFFDHNYILLIHLGMSGRLILKKNTIKFNKHDHFGLLINKKFLVMLNDPIKFGLVDVIQKKNLSNNKFLKNLGVEPLTTNFSPIYLKQISLKKKTNIKNLLLNQKLIAGLGNIYVNESLFASKISPFLIVNSLTNKQASLLCRKIKKILKNAINYKGSSINDFVLPLGQLGKFQNEFKVYNREGKNCKNKACNKKIIRIIISGRSTFYCKKCQKI